MSTLLITHPACLNHLTPAGHPERPERLRAVEHALEDERFQTLAREQAPAADAETIALCHPADFVDAIRDRTGIDIMEHQRGVDRLPVGSVKPFQHDFHAMRAFRHGPRLRKCEAGEYSGGSGCAQRH